MSTIEPEDMETTGYFLPEDSQLRLKQLRDYVGFLSNLARPRQSDEDAEWYAEIRPGEVAICLELLEEQIGQVLVEVAWPAERGGVPAGGDEEDTEHTEEGAEVAATEAATEVETSNAAEPVAAAKRYIAGVTLEQIDDINLLLDSLHAIGNVVACTDQAEFSDATLSTMGDAIYRDVDALRDIMSDINNNELEPPLFGREGVREEEATYLALPARLPPGRTVSLMHAHPTCQSRDQTGERATCRASRYGLGSMTARQVEVCST